MNKNKIILVNNKDETIKLENKQTVHKKGFLHRAISIFIFNHKKELMIQKRSFNKYHSAMLWSNTCCGHPIYGETNLNAAHRRLNYEMGFDCKLKKKFEFIYKSNLDNGMIEYEFDHVFFGIYNKSPVINLNEVSSWKWIKLNDLFFDINNNKNIKYTSWLNIIINKYKNNFINI